MATIIDLTRYPFLASIEYALSIKYPGLQIEDVLANNASYPYRRALELLKTIIKKGFVPEPRGTAEDEVLAYNSLVIGAKIIGDRRLLARIANAYSKYAYEKLAKESLANLVSIARALGINADLAQSAPRIPYRVRNNKPFFTPYPIRVPLRDYLRIVSKRLAHDPKYMLVNQVVDQGYVYLDKNVFTRILEEAIYNKIISDGQELLINTDKIREFISEYKKILEESGWFKHVEEYASDTNTGGYMPEALPPCMKILIDKLKAGENLSHHERFTVAAFLVNIGLDVDTILEFFKNTPDFNEKIARYQIEHIAGLRGSRKKYLPYNCDTMRSLGICPISESCNVKNPLVLYRRNLLKLNKKGKSGGVKNEVISKT